MSLYAFIDSPGGPVAIFGENCRSMDDWAKVHRQAKAGLLNLPCGCQAVPSRRPWTDQRGETKYFAHHPNTGCAMVGKGGGESPKHIELKSIAMAHLERKGLTARFERSGDGFRADLIVTNPKTGGDAIVEIQLELETPDVIEDRMRRRDASGKPQIWFFGGDNFLAAVPESIMAKAWCVSIGSDHDGMADRLRKAIDIWIANKLFFDTGNDLADCRFDLLALPAYCANCGRDFLSPQFIVARMPKDRHDLQDIPVHVKSHHFAPYAGDFLKSPYKGTPYAAFKQHGQVCPHCGARAPDFRMSKEMARRSPTGDFSIPGFQADARPISGLSFPRWRTRVENQGLVPFRTEEWAKATEGLTLSIRLGAKQNHQRKRQEQEEKRRKEEEKAQKAAEAEEKWRIEGDAREAEMRAIAQQTVTAVDVEIDFETWFVGGRFFFNGRRAVARQGGYDAQKLKDRLQAISGLVGPDAMECARKIVKDKEGMQELPIEHLLSPWRQVFDTETRDRIRGEVLTIARTFLGSDILAQEWMRDPNELFKGDTPDRRLAGDIQSLPDFHRVLGQQAPQWLKTRNRKQKLRDAATQTLGVVDGERWMKRPIEGYGDITPESACSSDTSFETCLNILTRMAKKKR